MQISPVDFQEISVFKQEPQLVDEDYKTTAYFLFRSFFQIPQQDFTYNAWLSKSQDMISLFKVKYVSLSITNF